MSKKVLLSVAVVALLAMTAFAGDYKYESWPTMQSTATKTIKVDEPQLIETIPVKIHIPYYVIIDPQNTEIMLEQQGEEGNERFRFKGSAKVQSGDNKGTKPTIHANFDAALGTDLTVLADGSALDTKDSKWTHGVTPDTISACVPAELDIWCQVTLVDLLAFQQCQTKHVADIDLYILPQ
jgi:hypothetical protein